ncbi:MAG: oxygenase MpaB family protein [Raineya sp.]
MSLHKTFTKDFLEKQRTLCDPWADTYASKILPLCEEKDVFSLLKWLNCTQKSYPHQLQPILKAFFSEKEIAPWADRRRMQQAANFFLKHENLILYLLGVLSLPYCYAARRGVQVLFLSKRLEKDTLQRLQETAHFVIRANSYSTENEVVWKNDVLKIRLLHALVRLFTLRSGKWKAEWGQPINQEDMAGTNLSFSYIVLRGMRKSGFAYTKKEAEDFLHLWNVIGDLLGVETSLLPDTMQEAFWLDKQISEKEFASSKEGQLLCKSLIEVFETQSPFSFFSDFAIAQMRFLLGEEISQILQIPSKGIDKIVPLLSLSERVASWLVPKGSIREKII